MAISVPSLVVGREADSTVQHLATDTNDAFNRLAAAVEDEIAAIDLSIYATLASPVFTGNPTAPTPSANDNDTSIATTAFVQTELADYAPLDSPGLTGTPTAPSASGSTDTTQIATTAFTQDAIDARAAAQSDQETGSSTTLFVTPGRQQFHPSAGKCWGYIVVSGGNPSLQGSYNTTSITDSGTGQVTVTVDTDFSNALNYSLVATGGTTTFFFVIGSKAIGSFRIDCFDTSAVAADPAHYSYATFGDQ